LSRTTRSGREYPLGATFDASGAGGTNFAVFSQNATRLELCLIDERGGEERLAMRPGQAHVWHLFVVGVAPGQRYGYRAHGPYDPAGGHRFNARKLLVDPYARALSGKVDYRAPVFGYAPAPPGENVSDLVPDARDDAWGVPRSIVVDPAFDWEGDEPPEVPWPDTVVYELHVKGFTRRHAGVPSEHRGTYLGVASEVAIAHLQSIGVTTVELMPVHEACDEAALVKRGMTNYWGYSTLAYFAPDQRFSSRPHERASQVSEFKQMVKLLHRARIEVVLDVVYNHSCEGDRFGPTLSLRGLDNAVYYRLAKDDRARYVDFTGCGNTLNITEPQTLKLIMDSLRYWVLEMHVDGFRFDLAPTLARDVDTMDKLSAFFDIIHQDPVLSRVKLIAEPWDMGTQGYQVGNFPVLWSEWNGRYRDTTRHFWLGERSKVGDFATRLAGSSDLYGDDGRRPHASINFVTAHDGFTLHDLVSYARKHNEANGQSNEDGTDDNASTNHGVEGDTDAPEIREARSRHARSLLATLFLSQGVPMLCAGDEIGRTQRGNNNAYVQDNPISWLDWDLDTPRTELLEFVRTLAAVRRAHPSFRRRAFLKSEDAIWLRPLARGEASTELPVMRGQDWADAAHAALGLLLRGAGPGCDPGDDDFILLANADPLPVVFVLPPAHWRVLADTQPSTSAVRPGTPGGAADSAVGSSSGQALDDAPLFSLSVGAGSLVLLARQSSSE
jgi:glycogen operon protein